jgi:hypothetical protein
LILPLNDHARVLTIYSIVASLDMGRCKRSLKMLPLLSSPVKSAAL